MTHIFVIHQLHYNKLPVSSLSMCLILKRSTQFLDGYMLFKDGIICCAAIKQIICDIFDKVNCIPLSN